MSGGSSIYIHVREIAPHKENWMIRARIIRLWTVTDCRNKSRVLSYEIVFIDRLGDKIQASISKQLVIIKNLHLDEGDFYDMKDVLVVPNDGSDRPRDVGIESIPDISRLLFNPPIPEALDMNGWLTMSGISLEGKIQFRQMEMPCLTLRDEFLLHHKKSDICDLNTNGEGGLFVVCAIITSLLENEAWWYTAYRPHACSSKGSSLYTCDGDYSIIPRYSVKVEVCDGTALTYLLLGDEHIEKLMQMSCRDMLSTLENPSSGGYPAIFDVLIGMRMLFLVQTIRSTNVHECYLRVKTLCTDRELIQMWLKGQYFHVDRRTTIAAMLGATRNAAPFSHAECSLYASARPVENFPTASSTTGHQSAGGSASVNNNHETNPAPHNTPQVDKHCVHVIQRSQEG
ncbi:Nucleic acid-binding, OB-fold [Sesbania bispinosa]|nr:Nucleic acid-binding, OB-fold [Sesbania bispinosa]